MPQLISRPFGIVLIPAMINLYVQPMIITKMQFKRYLKSFMSKTTSTKAPTKVNIAYLANHFIPKANL